MRRGDNIYFKQRRLSGEGLQLEVKVSYSWAVINFVYKFSVNRLYKSKDTNVVIQYKCGSAKGSKKRTSLTSGCHLSLKNVGAQETRNCFDSEVPRVRLSKYHLVRCPREYLANSSVSPDLSSPLLFRLHIITVLFTILINTRLQATTLSLATFLELIAFALPEVFRLSWSEKIYFKDD